MTAPVGIRREDKSRWERRTPLIPAHVEELAREQGIDIKVQPSKIRIFLDKDYSVRGIQVEEDLTPCPVIFALKEIPVTFFQKGKTYLFFSHTTKGQPHNMPMLKKMVEMECTLIDYEKIADGKGRRLLFFGREAGLAGMIDTLWALGQRLKLEKRETLFSGIEQAFRYATLVEAREQIQKIGWRIRQEGLHSSLVPLVFGFAGYGHVSRGAQEIFDLLPFEEISPEELRSFFRSRNYSSSRLYKVVFKEEHMVKPVSPGVHFELQDYYQNPQKYVSVFESYLDYLSVLVNCIYWEPKYPRLVTKKSLGKLFAEHSQPRLRIIGDISCDIEGAVECTVKATSPDNPVFTYNPLEGKAADGFERKGVAVMAIDNLPAEISLESSISFSKALKPFVPLIARADFRAEFSKIALPDSVRSAMVLHRGKFTPAFTYMEKFI